MKYFKNFFKFIPVEDFGIYDPPTDGVQYHTLVTLKLIAVLLILNLLFLG